MSQAADDGCTVVIVMHDEDNVEVHDFPTPERARHFADALVTAHGGEFVEDRDGDFVYYPEGLDW